MENPAHQILNAVLGIAIMFAAKQGRNAATWILIVYWGKIACQMLCAITHKYYCVSKEEKYTETAPFWLSVDGLNAGNEK